jgi:hypothetical protein
MASVALVFVGLIFNIYELRMRAAVARALGMRH